MKKIILMMLSLIVALLLTQLPLPLDLMWLRPAWVTIILIYWTFTQPYPYHLIIAFLVGILLDGLDGSLLGTHALALVVVVYLTLYLFKQMRFHSVFIQMFLVGFLVLVQQFILFLIEGINGYTITEWQFWLVPVVSMVYWPIIYVVLHAFKTRSQVKSS